MLINETGVYVGIVIMGAMILLVTAFLIVKSTSKKSTALRQPLENIESEVALKQGATPPSEAVDAGKVSAMWKIKRDILRGIRALRKSSTPPDQQPIDEGLVIREQTRLPDLASLGLQVNILPSSADQEALNTKPADEQETEANMLNTAPVGLEQGLSNVAPVNEQETEGNMIDSFPTQLAEPAQEPPQEGLEQSEHEPEEEDKAPDEEHQEQPQAKDDVFAMFKDEMVEESDMSKFAATLDNVDVHDLLEEAQSLVNNISRSKD